MEKIIRAFLTYYNQIDFRKFQNNFAKEIYDSLVNSYSNQYNEVNMVTEMSTTIDGKEFQGLKFHTKKIHGTRSFVEFYNQDRPVTTELADMVIISVATENKEIIYEKIAFVQNKKEDTKENWKIDQDQLFLLHNFPTFRGKKGIFKHNFSEEVAFFNYSNSLGNYGFFQSPGEMILITALTVYKLQLEKKISLADIRKFSSYRSSSFNILTSMEDWFVDELIYSPSRYNPSYGFDQVGFPFLNNRMISLNIIEFIRNWTLFNIGELVSLNGKVIDKELSNLNRILLREAGFSNQMNLNVDENSLENSLVVVVAHLNLDQVMKN